MFDGFNGLKCVGLAMLVCFNSCLGLGERAFGFELLSWFGVWRGLDESLPGAKRMEHVSRADSAVPSFSARPT